MTVIAEDPVEDDRLTVEQVARVFKKFIYIIWVEHRDTERIIVDGKNQLRKVS
jgi:hypothetical protein